jgi:hypothetical protein
VTLLIEHLPIIYEAMKLWELQIPDSTNPIFKDVKAAEK